MPSPSVIAGGPVSPNPADRPVVGFTAVYAIRIDPADVGRRVTVRRRLDDGRTGDVVGVLQSWTKGGLTIQRRNGETVEVDEATLLAAKVVAPELSAADLQRQCARDWRAREVQAIGPWTARFHDAVNRRSNSALALDVPDDLEATLAAVTTFYRARDTAPLVLAVSGSAVDAALEAAGVPVMLDNDVLIGATSELAGAAPGPPHGATIDLQDTPPERLLQLQAGAPEREAALRELLATSPHARYAIVHVDGAPVATARTTTSGGWAGLTFVEVDPAVRRRGIAAAMIGALAADAHERRVPLMWLQVESDNDGARALYTSLGFERHHGYRYRRLA
jgi:GNAT superfamily N-acetyltransferase